MNRIERLEFEEEVRQVNLSLSLGDLERTELRNICCPFCNAPFGDVKFLGQGYYRCKGKNRINPCGTFFLAKDREIHI